ncbi:MULTISPECIES: leucine-rich repeat protein [unclassified Acinetobacter]|uniref:leucine-rich repeat protein n=1 Tax=unclassified Acinetobacter TaxID=196816 RepID=UPI0015D19505|nr:MULTISPECIES: leucine-rich repeat protein [unclassified Acinetobacter]
MAIYTGIADENGDFTIPFSTTYSGGEKITVTAEKGAASKSIEIYAPSSLGGAVILFSGDAANFPVNLGTMTVNIDGSIPARAFSSATSSTSTANSSFFAQIKHLEISSGATSIGDRAFYNWTQLESVIIPNTVTSIGPYSFDAGGSIQSLNIPDSVQTIGQYAFRGQSSCTEVNIGSGILSISNYAFANLSACDTVTITALTPPTIEALTFNNIKSTCIFKVPAASVAAYQAAPNWSAFASRIQAI